MKIHNATSGVALVVAVLSLAIAVRSDAERSAATNRDHDSTEKLVLYARHDSELVYELDLGQSGETPGDRFVIAAPLFDAPDGGRRRANALVDGYRVGEQVQENVTLAFRPGNQIVASGWSTIGRPSLLSITGGSGRYADARGTITVEEIGDGVKLVIQIER
ncbi:MAG TPA: hypothetical protein VM784_15180 [Actinomycetota bacterium]|nr:hypothetical protein [Actinomycetota bacterium]